MRKITVVLALAAGVLTVLSAGAQYRTGDVYTQTQYTEFSGSPCGGTVYDPELFVLPDGDVQMFAQGPHASIVDKFYAFRRDSKSGQWSGSPTAPGVSAAPAIEGEYMRCGYSPDATNGPIASPSVVRDPFRGRYFMAFSGGNADAITGRVYGATSKDGVDWTYYDAGAGRELITPIIYPVHHEICNVARNTGGSGVGQLEMVLDGGYFIFWLRYGHALNDAGGTLFDYERIAFRISYDPNAESGFGSTRQIWYDGAWRNHSGKLVWDYNLCEDGPCRPAAPGDFILGRHRSVMNMKFGAGDVKYDSTLFYWGYWVHFAQSVAGEQIEWEYSDLRTPEWIDGGTLDVSTVLQAFPGAQIYYPGLYFYNAWHGGVQGDYIFIPLDPGNSCTVADYGGLRIVAAQLLK